MSIEKVGYTLICMLAGVGFMHLLQLAQVLGALGIAAQ